MFENITTADLLTAATANSDAAKAKLELLHDLQAMHRMNTPEYRYTWEQIDALMICSRMFTDEYIRRVNQLAQDHAEAPGA